MNPAEQMGLPEEDAGGHTPPPADGEPAAAARVPERVVVVGTTGSGKTRLAARLALLLGVPHVEIDALNWGPNWEAAAPQVLQGRVSQALDGPAWVVDGNYSQVRDITWGRADTLVWLDYPFFVVLGRLLWRTLSRLVNRKVLWGTNRETWRSQFLSRDSLFLWAIQTHWRRRKEYAALLGRPEYACLRVVRLRSPRAARAWLAALEEVIGRRTAR